MGTMFGNFPFGNAEFACGTYAAEFQKLCCFGGFIFREVFTEFQKGVKPYVSYFSLLA